MRAVAPASPAVSTWRLLGVALLALVAIPTLAAAQAAPATPPAGGAQQPQAPPIPLEMTLIRGCKVPPDAPSSTEWTSALNLKLSRDYNNGDWKAVQGTLHTFIMRLRCTDSLLRQRERKRLQFEDGDEVSVVFLDEALEAPALARVLVHLPRPEVFGNRVAGFKMFDLQLFADPRLLVASRYQATTAPNPLLAKLPTVLPQLSTGLVAALPAAAAAAGAAGGAAAAPLGQQAPPTPRIYIVHRVELPHPFKALDSSVVPQVSVADQFASPVTAPYVLRSLADRSCKASYVPGGGGTGTISGKVADGTGSPVNDGAVILVRDPLFRPGCTDPVSQLNDRLRASFLALCAPAAGAKIASGQFSAQVPEGDYIAVVTSGGQVMLTTHLVTVTAGGSTNLDIKFKPTFATTDAATSCKSALAAAIDDLAGIVQQADAIAQVENLYATYNNLANTTQPTVATQPTAYTLGRLTRFAFSLGTAVLAHPNLNTPAKTSTITSGQGATATSTTTLAANNPTTPLTFVAFDYHPWAYDETYFSPTRAERFRIFAGVALTPDAGVVAGVGMGLVRGLSIEAGYSLLLESSLARGESLANPTVILHSPTPRKGVGAAFLGIGYSFP